MYRLAVDMFSLTRYLRIARAAKQTIADIIKVAKCDDVKDRKHVRVLLVRARKSLINAMLRDDEAAAVDACKVLLLQDYTLRQLDRLAATQGISDKKYKKYHSWAASQPPVPLPLGVDPGWQPGDYMCKDAACNKCTVCYNTSVYLLHALAASYYYEYLHMGEWHAALPYQRVMTVLD